MNQPTQPKPHPDTPAKDTTVPGHAPDGVPDGAEAEAKGSPISDRQKSETAGKS